MKTKKTINIECAPDNKRSIAFKNIYAAQLHEENIQQKVDELMMAFHCCDYRQVLAVLDWMKATVTDSAFIITDNENAFSCAESDTFPLKTLYFRKKYK